MSTFSCQLYLSAPEGHPVDVLVSMLDEALTGNNVAAVLYTPPAKSANGSASALMKTAINHGAAFIVAGDLALAKQIGADGIHISGNIEAYKTARTLLGDDAIIGVSTSLNRHDSMCVGELGSSYIQFDPDVASTDGPDDDQSLEQIITWWSELFEVPCVARADADMDQNRALINAGVDFLVTGSDLWNSTPGAGPRLKSLFRLIAECGRAQ